MILSREQVRSLDQRAIQEFGVPGIVLMENAGRGAAELLLSLGVHGQVTIVCGKGYNGGDGFVIARHLELHRVRVRLLVLTAPEAITGDAATNFHIVRRSGLPIALCADREPDDAFLRRELSSAEWVVDAILGTGLTGPVRAPIDRAIAAINQSGSRVLAVDIPSGLDADTGEPLGAAVRAEHTATFVALKKGFTLPAARAYLGEVHVVGIGAPATLLAQFE